MGLFDNLRTNVERLPDHPALQLIGEKSRETFSYGRVGSEVRKIGAYLSDRGVGPGDRVGILMENHPRWGIAFLAAQSAGAVVVPLDTQHTAPTLAKLIRHAQCRFLIVSEKLAPLASQIMETLPEMLPVLWAGRSGPPGGEAWDEVLERQGERPQLPLVERSLDDPLVIIYTSGTTGDPKGVVLSERSIYRNMEALLKIVKADEGDHILSVLPLFHVLALMTNFIIPLQVGARVTYLDVLDAPRILKAFEEEGITIFVCVPQFFYLVHRRIFQEIGKQSMLRRFLFRRLFSLSRFFSERYNRRIGKYFFKPIHRKFGSHFRLFGVGGARFDAQVAKDFRDLGFIIVQAYGMTETAALTTVTPISPQGVDSVGRPLPHVQVRIDQPDENGIGEVLIAGENLMHGYLDNPDATAEVLKNNWLHSGDLGYIDADGFLYITGRKKDVIILSSGKNIYPEEIEHFYQSNCPLIKEMCVVGVNEDEAAGAEKLHGVIVPDFDQVRQQQVVNVSDMIRYLLETLSQQVPPYKRVRSFEIRRDPLPRTTTRKIKRFELERELKQQSRPQASAASVEESQPSSPVEARIYELLRQFKKVPSVSRSMSLEFDLGFESLERVEFLSILQETFRVHISDEAATELFSVGDLVSAVEKRMSGEVQDEGEEVRTSWAELLKRPLTAEEEQTVEATLRARFWQPWAVYLTAKIAYLFAKVFFRLRVSGLEQLPRQGCYMICPNHLSFLDVFVVVSGLPYRVVKKIFFLGYSDYFESGLMGFLGRLYRVVPVDADLHLRKALRLAAEGLARGLVLCVFPEGERSIDGHLKPFRKGPAILACEGEVPAVPVGITGSFQAWPRGSNKIRLHPIEVRFGQPLPAPAPGTSYDEYNHRLVEAVLALTQPPEPERIRIPA